MIPPDRLGLLCWRLWRLVQLCVVAWLCTPVSALGLTLEQIVRIYEQKIEKLGAYQVRYYKNIEDTRSGRIVSEHHYAEQVLASESGYRFEVSILNAPGSEPVPLTFQTNDKDQFRSLSFTSKGAPNTAAIKPANRPFEAWDKILYSPIGLAGLHDSSRCTAPGDSGTFSNDIAALARHPRSRLVEEPVMLGDEKAYLIEWPAGVPHPSKRAWLSADKNFALLRYESYDPDESGKYQTLTQEINTDFVEVTPGLFLPRKSEFRCAEDSQIPAQVISITAISYDLGIQISPEDIRLTFPDGVRVDDQISGTKYVMGDHTNLKTLLDNDTKKLARALDDGVARDVVAAPSELVLARAQQPNPGRARTWTFGTWVVIPAVLLLAASTAIVLLMRRKKKRSA